MKTRLTTILIITGIIIWLSIAFFFYSSRYSSAAQRFSFYSAENYEDQEDLLFRQVKFKLTLVLLKNDMVFGYLGDSLSLGKIVPLSETDTLIKDGWRMFSKESLVVYIKQTNETSYKAIGDILDKMSTNQIEDYRMASPNKNEREFLKIDE